MTFFVFSLGCKVNSYECSALASLLIQRGYIQDESNPDIVIVNTCSVTHVADQKSRQHIRKFRNEFPNAVIVVMGCYSQGNGEFVLKECGADIVLGTSKRSEIPLKIEEFLQNRTKNIDINSETRTFDYDDLGITACSENIRAYLKVQDGCDNFCTYCLIPYRRGRSRSRPLEQCITEAKQLVNLGYKEIVVTGIHIGMYGKDINTNFSTLIEELCKIENLYRIRISSLEESEIDEKLIYLLNHEDKLAKHLHIPLQSGSDTTLKRMGRRYDSNSFYNKLSTIRSLLPNVCFTTDVIVGFPGESEENFLETYNFIKKVGFNQIHVFPYSPRSGTPAEKYKDQINPKIKKERVHDMEAFKQLVKNLRVIARARADGSETSSL